MLLNEQEMTAEQEIFFCPEFFGKGGILYLMNRQVQTNKTK